MERLGKAVMRGLTTAWHACDKSKNGEGVGFPHSTVWNRDMDNETSRDDEDRCI